MALRSAQQGMNTSLDSLGATLKDYQTNQKQAWEQEKQLNANAVLDRLSQFNSPEQLQQAIASGNINQMIMQYGTDIDSSKVRGAAEQRLAALQQQAVANNQFQDQTQERNQRGVVDQVGQLIAQGKMTEAQAILGQHELLGEEKLWSQMTAEERARAAEQRSADQAVRNQQSHNLNMQNGQVTLKANKLRLQDLQSTQQANQVGQQIQQEWTEQLDHIQAGHTAIAEEMGIPVGKNGQVETAGVPEEKLLAFKSALREAGVPDLPSTTQFLEQQTNRLLATGANPTAINEVIQGLSTSLGGSNLAPRDKQYVEEGVSAVTAKFDNDVKVVQTQLQDLEKTNPLVRMNSLEPYEAQSKIQQAVQKASKNEAEREELANIVHQVTQKGIEIAPGSFVEVPPSMIEAAVAKAGNAGEGWFFDTKAGAFNDALKEMASDPSYDEQWQGYTKYLQLKTQKGTLELQKTLKAAEAKERLLNEVGGTASRTENLQRRLLNQRTP